MLTHELHECPRCESPVPREDYARVRIDDRTDEFMHCPFCGYGLEVSRYSDGAIYVLDYQERTEPVNFGRFLQRLEDARAA
jgi:endogenous inhibitor of DNA gyrase (YacG/DUF329 family)